MNDEHLSEHDRITNNTQANEDINLRLSAIEQRLSSQVQTIINADKGNYSIAFEPNAGHGENADEVGITACEVAMLAGGFTAFGDGEKFYRNLTSKTVTLTITIKNKSDSFGMDVIIAGNIVTNIKEDKTVTITVEVPAGECIQADKDGEYRIDAVK